MSWKRAWEADARLAAKNAVKIRAALRQSIDAERVAEAYLASLPPTTGNLTQSRARARAWAIINIRVNLEPLRLALLRTLADGYVLGTVFAEEQVALAKKRQKSVSTQVNWATWKPGDEAAALLVKPPKAFERLLGRYGLTLKGFSDTTLNDIGNSLGESLELGLSATQTAKRLKQYVASSSRALSIAVTEQNRAISVATVNRYKEMGVEKHEWIASDPCDECEPNDGQVVVVGEAFASGDTEPPVHPNCRCALLPVIRGMETTTQESEEAETITGSYMRASYVADNNETDIYDYYTPTKVKNYYGLTAKGEIDWESPVRGNQNNFLKNLLDDQGFLNKPRVISPAEFGKLAEQGNPVIYRGIAADSSEQLTGYVDDLLRGDKPFVGRGMFGDGIYFADKLEIAESFTKEDALGKKKFSTGRVVKAIIDPQAKIVDFDDLLKEMRASYDLANYGKITETYPEDFYGTYSSFAAARGYDGIRKRKPKISWRPDAAPVDGDYIVILNRTALIIEDTK